MRDKIAQDKKNGLKNVEAAVKYQVAQKAANAKQQSKATRDTLVKMKELEVKAKQNWVLKAKAERVSSDFDKFEKREFKNLKERELSEQRAREARQARDDLARELADLEQQEKAALSGLNLSVCQKNLILNEVVDLMNRKVTKDELLLLQGELQPPAAGCKDKPASKHQLQKETRKWPEVRHSLQSPTRKKTAAKLGEQRLDTSAVLIESPRKSQLSANQRLTSSSSSVTRSLKVLQPSRILEQIERQRSAAQIHPKKPRQPTVICAVPEEDRERDLETPQKPRATDSSSRLPKATSAAVHLLTEKASLKQDTKFRNLTTLSEFEISETPKKAAGRPREKSTSVTPHQTPKTARSIVFSSKKLASPRPSTIELNRQSTPLTSKQETPRHVKLLWNPEPRKAAAAPAETPAAPFPQAERLQTAARREASEDAVAAGFSGCKNFDFEFMTEE